MKKVYIKGIGSISAQKTFDNTEFLNEIIDHEENPLPVVDPIYKAYIPPAAARRMAKGIKMGVVASKIAMNEAHVTNVDAIITGTGLGCIKDSEKFVGAIITDNEQYLTPTSFIQSTHNTVAGQIALGIGCKGYNFTYVHASVSFESALLDAQLQLETNEAENILVGGVDELTQHHIDTHKLIGHVKTEPILSSQVLNSTSKGAILAEGANFFVLTNEKEASNYAELIAVETYNTLDTENLEKAATVFLKENNLSSSDIDLVILGNNGDIDFDNYYHTIGETLFENTQQICYKHLIGEFHTAPSFAFWLAAKILKSQTIPEEVKLNTIETSNINTILIYNQYRGQNHSFVVLQKC